MLNKIFSSNIEKTGLLIDWKFIESEDEFLYSPIINQIDEFSMERGKYMKFDSVEKLIENAKKYSTTKKNPHIYVIFDENFKIEISYLSGDLFYVCVEKYAESPPKKIFIDDAKLFSKQWEINENEIKFGKTTLYVESKKLNSIMQNA